MKPTLLGLGIWLALVAALVSLFLTGCSSPPAPITYESITYETPAGDGGCPESLSDGGCAVVDYDDYLPAMGSAQVGRSWHKTSSFTTQSHASDNVNAAFDRPMAYTIQFGIDLPAPALGAEVVCEALIVWSVQGTQVTRKVSIVNGASISGLGEGVNIIITDKTATGAPGAGAPYQVTTHIVPGIRPSQEQPPRFNGIPNQLFTAPAGFITAVPQVAGVISVNVLVSQDDPANPATVQVLMQDAAGAVVASYEADKQFGFVMLAPGTTAINLQIKGTAGNKVNAAIYWGIDG